MKTLNTKKLASLLATVVLILTLANCTQGNNKGFLLDNLPETKEYRVTFVVHYPSTTDTLVIRIKAKQEPFVGSNRGSNYIWAAGEHYSSTAPIQIIRTEVINQTPK